VDLAAAVDMITWLAPCWGATPQLLADYLILGYRRAGGPGHLYPAIQGRTGAGYRCMGRRSSI
jgi:hypothetical protein